MPHSFDATLKEMLGQDPQDYAPVFDFPSNSPARALNVDLSTLSAATDVAFGFGEPLQEIVDLNFQSGADPSLPARLHLYNAAFHFRFKVPVRSVAILLRPKADTSNLTGSLTYVAGNKRVEFEYDVVRMWHQPVTPFLHGGLGLLPLATLCQLQKGPSLADSMREVVREIDQRLIKEPDHARAVRLMTASFILSGLRVEKRDLATIFDGVRVMHETTAYDYYVEEAQIRCLQGTLLRQGRQQFGEPDAATESDLEAIKDLDRLGRMTDAVLKAKSWHELLATE